MTDMHDIVETETAKRDRRLSEHERWHMIMAAIDWADRQQPVSRNSPQACKRHEEEVHAQLIKQGCGGMSEPTA